MKKLIVIVLVLLSTAAFAVTRYKTPDYIVTYVDNGLTLSANGGSVTAGLPQFVRYGESRTITLNIINKKLGNFYPNVKANIKHQHGGVGTDGGIVYIEYHDSPDFVVGSGCDGLLPIGSTCSVDITFTSVAPDVIDGTPTATTNETLRLFNGGLILKEYNLTGYAQ